MLLHNDLYCSHVLYILPHSSTYYCIVLYTAIYSYILYCTAIYYSKLLQCATYSSILLHSAVLYILHHSALYCYIPPYCPMYCFSRLGLDCVKTLDANAGFQADVFLTNIGGSHAVITKLVTAFPELILPLNFVTFLLATIFSIVWTCDCCLFADFRMATALILKNYQINLLNYVWYILSILCTRFVSFSSRLNLRHTKYEASRNQLIFGEKWL